MTEIGKMIRDEGIEEGKTKGKSEIIIRQILKKFKKLWGLTIFMFVGN
ncbi:hypothetical protein [Clostridium sp. AWRP]|nr:hypothetical protein [Clostridium sp. AWRP]